MLLDLIDIMKEEDHRFLVYEDVIKEVLMQLKAYNRQVSEICARSSPTLGPSAFEHSDIADTIHRLESGLFLCSDQET
jgi:hypothetical protein